MKQAKSSFATTLPSLLLSCFFLGVAPSLFYTVVISWQLFRTVVHILNLVIHIHSGNFCLYFLSLLFIEVVHWPLIYILFHSSDFFGTY